MKLDFNSFPLNVYNKEQSKSLLMSLGNEVPNVRLSNQALGQAILSSFVKHAAGAGLLSLIDSVSIGLKGDKARKCLSNLIIDQTNRVIANPSIILYEAQINLLATSCITDYLASLESGSWGNGVKNIAKSLIGILSLKNPLNVIWESVVEVTNKYNDICQVYFIAFLLNIYNSVPNTESTIKKLIKESLSNDSEGESSFDLKKRPVLFSGSQYESLEDNLKNRIHILSEATNKNKDLYDPFVKSRIDLNAESV